MIYFVDFAVWSFTAAQCGPGGQKKKPHLFYNYVESFQISNLQRTKHLLKKESQQAES